MNGASLPARRFLANALLAASTGGFCSFALPADALWMRGRGHFILFATAPLFFALANHFQHAQSSLPKKMEAPEVHPEGGPRIGMRAVIALAGGLLLAWVGCGSIEIGYFWWTSLGMQIFLGIAPLAAVAIACVVILAHATLGLGAVVPFFIARFLRGTWPRRVAALAFASLVGAWLESLAPRMFPYALGSFLSLHPWTSPLLALGGSTFATALVLFTGGTLALVASASGRARIATIAVAAVSLGVFELGWTQPGRNLIKEQQRGPEGGSHETLDVLLVQPAIAVSKQVVPETVPVQARLARERAFEIQNLDALVMLTKKAFVDGARPDLVVWPESLLTRRLRSEPEFRAHIDEALSVLRVPVLAHVYDTELGDTPSESGPGAPLVFRERSIAKLLEPGWFEAQTVVYEKQGPMPFGEYVPWRPLMSALVPASALSRFPVRNDEERQRPAGLFAVAARGVSRPVRLAPAICFDGIFDTLGRSQAEEGADVIVNLSNLEWLGSGVAENVFRSIVRLRGIETATSLLFVNNSGGTAAYSPSGELLAGPLPHGESAFLRARVPLANLHSDGTRKQTPFVQTRGRTSAVFGIGGWIGLALLFILRRREAKDVP